MVQRKFTLFDGMVLVAVCAISLAGMRALRGSSRPPGWWGVTALQDSAWVALACSLALIPLRLHGPRPRSRRLWRQPGWLACLGAVLAVTICFIQRLLSFSVILLSRRRYPVGEVARKVFEEVAYRAPNEVIFSVGTTWLILALSGRWSPEKSWIDRLGRALGVYWIAFPLLVWVVELVAFNGGRWPFRLW